MTSKNITWSKIQVLGRGRRRLDVQGWSWSDGPNLDMICTSIREEEEAFK